MDTHKLIALMPDLATFIVIVDEGSYTAASRKLGVTPSALSKQIARLEKTLSVICNKHLTPPRVEAQ